MYLDTVDAAEVRRDDAELETVLSKLCMYYFTIWMYIFV